ncbi:MAG: hypothetical protein M0Q53_05255 [Prolixibacteraceae bacterium]|nr:hypothetical protein [Prolixibacteraceae bacterium]
MELINEGEVNLGFTDAATGKPRRAAEEFTGMLKGPVNLDEVDFAFGEIAGMD